jgi:hypothetical protein
MTLVIVYIIIIIRMNVVDNLNLVRVIAGNNTTSVITHPRDETIHF